MIMLRRFLVVIGLMFWQGGFTFYTAVVVPVGTDVLGSPLEQGWITRRVTVWLNVAGVVALAFLAWELASSHPQDRRRNIWCWLIWVFLAAALLALFLIHLRLEALLAVEQGRVLDRPTFRSWHSVYLWISTLQWVGILATLWLMIASWQEPRNAPGSP